MTDCHGKTEHFAWMFLHIIRISILFPSLNREAAYPPNKK
jgi:hypothetical protein